MTGAAATGAILIFDLDGTLFHTETVTLPSAREAFAAHGLTPPTDAEIVRLTTPDAGDEAVDALLALGYPVTTAREAVRAARSAEEEAPVETIIKEALRRL